ncbi:MAG: OmpA family protein [Polyangiaceae bacterium]|nr:OmpA family protein [Polyangiaceae bacterium]
MALKRTTKCIATILGIGAAALLARPAAAQGLPLNRLEPAPAGDRFFGVESPFAAGSATPHLMLLGDYAHNPLVLKRTSDDSNVGHVVQDQLFLHLNASLALFNRLNLNVELPIALAQNGGSPSVGGVSFNSPSGATIGDLRLGARLRLLGDYHDAFQLAVGGYVWVPTAEKDVYVGDGKARGMPQLILGGGAGRVIWSLAGGVEFARQQWYGGNSVTGVKQGTMIRAGAGIAVQLGAARHWQIGPEVNFAVPTQDISKRNTNLEAMLDIRWRVVHDFEIGIGGGPGLTNGIGTPDFRGVLMLAYTPEQRRDRDGDGIPDDEDACPDVPGVKSDDPAKNGCPESDRDGDGILDKDDACPDVPGVASSDPSKNGCPLPKDRDGDGIPDDVDACPDVPGVPNADPKLNGCPPDRDGDGIPDAEDACPDVKGVRSPDPKKNGCPPDSDGDGIPDDVDACPFEKGVPDPDPTKNGCPKHVRVRENKIEILQQVQFDTGKATIRKVSDELLDEVAGVLKEHPEVTKVEIQGHTDNRGAKQMNMKLSQGRADAVEKALVSRGVDKARLTTHGYGPEQPIADNKTDAGRQTNRRVEFKILEKAPRHHEDRGDHAN